MNLPIRKHERIAEALEQNGMPVNIPGEDTAFNCWNFTAYYLGWVNRAFWMERERMEQLLADNSKPIKAEEAGPGDIAVFRSYGRTLAHTAIVMKKDVMCHKPGQLDLAIETLRSVINTYGDCVSYVRPLALPA
jgi:cell wall-associated NlpC family hydrolase